MSHPQSLASQQEIEMSEKSEKMAALWMAHEEHRAYKECIQFEGDECSECDEFWTEITKLEALPEESAPTTMRDEGLECYDCGEWLPAYAEGGGETHNLPAPEGQHRNLCHECWDAKTYETNDQGDGSRMFYFDLPF